MKKTNLVLGFMLIIILAISTSMMAQNNALDFDGSNDYVECGIMNLSFQSFGIEGWFKVDELPPSSGSYMYDDIFGIETGVDAAILRINGADNRLEFVMGWNSGTQVLRGNEIIQVGQWYHVAILFQHSVRYMHIVINGEIDASLAISGGDNNYSNNYFRIGGQSNVRSFDGLIDEVKVWRNIDRTEEEIRTDMYKDVVGNETGLVAYYKLDETSGTNANDSQSSSTYDGTLTNMTGNEWTTSPSFFGPKNCLNFDGDDDNVWCANISPTVTSGSIEFWVNLDVIPTDNARLISRHSSYGYDEIYLLNNDGRIFTAGSFVVGDDLQSTDPLPTDVWTHVAITADGSGSKLYINGILDDTGGATDFDYNTFRFGGQYTAGFYECIDGMMDEVRLWNDVRTESEIRENMFKSLVGDESNLVAYYNLDNTVGSVAQSYPTVGNDGSVGGGATWVTSTAFNTWLNTDDNSWSEATNWSLGSVPSTIDNVGIFNYTSGVAPALSGSPTLNNLVVDDTFTLSSGLTITDQLILENDLDLNGQTIILGSTANLIESGGNLYGTSGTIQTTRDLSNIDEDVAGLGAEITTSANMGRTTIIRGHQAQGGNAINRYYQINPITASGLDATLVLNYLDTELNGVTEDNMELFKSPDGSDWTVQSSSSINTTDNTLTLTGIDSFSWWTAGDGDAPLPVNLSSFYALFAGGTPTLYWTTQSEENNAYWNVYRGTTDTFTTSVNINANDPVPGNGTTNSASDYIYLDTVPVVQNAIYWYWIEDVSTNGETTVHDPITLSIPFEDTPVTPDTYGLQQNYPNPFNPSTSISFALTEESNVELIIYNVKGEKVKTIFNDHIYADQINSVVWNGKDADGKQVSSGVYFYKLKAGTREYNKKMLMVK